jgi:RimJ/RimL family protein N-acetyltransferase
MKTYSCLKTQIFRKGKYSIVPIREEDKFPIMKWRNEQLFHLRQKKPLTLENQEKYFSTIINSLFDRDFPEQILFSFLENEKCIGYGGLVHINWIDKNAEISFVLETALERDYFCHFWKIYLSLIELVAFTELTLHKIFTYAFDLRPQLYSVLEESGYHNEARFKGHCYFEGKFIDVLIHTKFNMFESIYFRPVALKDAKLIFEWANEQDVRRFAVNSENIEWDAHMKWFDAIISDVKSNIFIFFNAEDPIGQVRLEYIGSDWHIDYSISRKFRGLGYGSFMLSKIIGMKRFSPLKAYVKPENIPSLNIFNNLGFNNLGFANKNSVELVEFEYV